jgi:hypothetical protein
MVVWQKFTGNSKGFCSFRIPYYADSTCISFRNFGTFLPDHISSHSGMYNSLYTPLCEPQISHQEIRLKWYFILQLAGRIINDCQPDKINIMKDAGTIHHSWHLTITTVIHFGFHVL